MVDCLFPQSTVSAPESSSLSSDIPGRFFVEMLAGAVTCLAAMQPLRELAARMRSRFMSDPDEPGRAD